MRPTYWIILIFISSFVGCGSKQEAPQTIHLPVKTAKVKQAFFYRTYEGYGRIQSSQATDLVARFDGIIRLNLKRNGRYKKGEWIYSLSGPAIERKRTELQANLKLAETQFNLAKQKLQRRTALRKQNLLSMEKWQELQQNLEAAKQSLQKARSNWNFFAKMTRYRAPYDGILSGPAVSQGDFIRAGTPVAKFLAASQLQLVTPYFGDPALLRRFPRMIVFLNDSLRAAGHVLFQSRAVEAGTGAHELWLALDSVKMLLTPRMFVKFRLQFDGHRAPAVPEKALVREGNRYFVVISKNGIYKNQPVKIGRRNGPFRELLQGPPVGTRVVTTSAFEYFYKNLEKTMGEQD